MSIKISELPQATSVTSSDIVPIVQNGTTKKATAEMINLDNYSTTEQRIGTWIDGKPLYQKTYELTCPTTNYGEVQQNISDLNFDKIANISGIANMVQGSNSYYRIINNSYAYNQSTVVEFSGCWINGTTLFYRYSGYNGLVSFKVYITLCYTKTTDTTTRTLNLTRTLNTIDDGEIAETKLATEQVEDIKEAKEVEEIADTNNTSGDTK